MNVASLELCKELHELSGWQPDSIYRYPADTDKLAYVAGGNFSEYGDDIPAYDLGYLLRKLPRKYYVRRHNDRQGADWWAYKEHAIVTDKEGEGILADTPEDAACKLAIELIKSGVLPHGEK